jgi:hypothetical protein
VDSANGTEDRRFESRQRYLGLNAMQFFFALLAFYLCVFERNKCQKIFLKTLTLKEMLVNESE